MLKKLISATLIASLVITSSICVFAKDDNGNHNGWYKNGKLVKDKIEKQVKNGWWYIPPMPYYPTEVTDPPSDIPSTMHDTGRVTEDGLPIYANDGGVLWVYLGDGVFDTYEGGLIDDEPPLPPDDEGDIGEPPLPDEPSVEPTDEPEVVVVTSDDVNTGRWIIKGKTTETTKHGVTIVTEGAHVEYNGKDVYQKPEPIENGQTVKIVGKSTEVTKHGRTIVTDGAHYEIVRDMPV